MFAHSLILLLPAFGGEAIAVKQVMQNQERFVYQGHERPTCINGESPKERAPVSLHSQNHLISKDPHGRCDEDFVLEGTAWLISQPLRSTQIRIPSFPWGQKERSKAAEKLLELHRLIRMIKTRLQNNDLTIYEIEYARGLYIHAKYAFDLLSEKINEFDTEVVIDQIEDAAHKEQRLKDARKIVGIE